VGTFFHYFLCWPKSMMVVSSMAVRRLGQKLRGCTALQSHCVAPCAVSLQDNLTARALGSSAAPDPTWAPEQGGLSSHATAPKVTLRCHKAALQGMRPHMEDRMCSILRLPGQENAALFGIFDGHRGAEAAEFAAAKLPGHVARNLSEDSCPQQVLSKSFCQVDDDLRNLDARRFSHCGSTAVVVLFNQTPERGLQLFCANSGDSRAVLCRRGEAVDLSHDHKPQSPGERARIEAAGGSVKFIDTWRLDGDLSLSRAFGDFAYKARSDLPPSAQKLTVVPEIQQVELESFDEFVVLGSDGVFDALTSEALITGLCTMRAQRHSWEVALQGALKRALVSGDNVSLCLIELVHDVASPTDVRGTIHVE